MVDNPFLLPIIIPIQPSIRPFLVFSLAATGAACGIWISALPALLQLILSLLLVTYCLHLYYLWHKRAPHKLILMPDNRWRIIDYNNYVYPAQLKGRQYLHQYLLILQLYWDNRRHFVLLMPTANSAEKMRRLRVRIAYPSTLQQ